MEWPLTGNPTASVKTSIETHSGVVRGSGIDPGFKTARRIVAAIEGTATAIYALTYGHPSPPPCPRRTLRSRSYLVGVLALLALD